MSITELRARITVPCYHDTEKPQQKLITHVGQLFHHKNVNVVQIKGYDDDVLYKSSPFGVTFDVFTRDIFLDCNAGTIRNWQKTIGANGDVAPFLTWLAQEQPFGWFVTIPTGDAELNDHFLVDVRAHGPDPYYPCYGRMHSHCFFGTASAFYGASWFGTAVAFRRVNP